MRVVYLEHAFLREVIKSAVGGYMPAHDRLNRGRDKEILLLQAQRFALDMLVRGVENLRYRVRHSLLLAGLYILTARKQRHIKRRRGFRVPQPERVHMVGLVSAYFHVARYCEHRAVALVHNVELSVIPELTKRASELDLFRLLRFRYQPRVSHFFPVVRKLDLLSVHYALLEYSELVADRISGGGYTESRHRVEIARGKPAEAAVAEARVRLYLEYIRGFETHRLYCLSHRSEHAEVERVFHQAPAHQKLKRHVMHLPAVFLSDAFHGLAPV
ncbi:hypothetical protein SDC9_136953 [bioreactor metagenome]|uniref:Uncharacterized protein n=1 Tax=bioreactor metagenome TaxID=1076179 RepID=A0A645DL86_9ZZZZ